MSRHSMIERMGGFRVAWLALLAVAVLVLGASDVGAQLVYVDAIDDFDPGSQNLFPSAGGPLSGALVNNAANTGDNLWGWIEAGAPTGGAASVYESNTENAPELRMHVAAPNGSYDAYAVFWADVNVQFFIRAGLTSNPGTNTVFARTNANGATAGTFAASAIWATPPEDDPNTVNDDNDNDTTDNILNPLTGANPFVDHVPAGGGGMRMYLAPLGMVTASGGAGFNVFIDDLPSTNDQNRTRFDGVAYVATGTDVSLEATIDRATGNLTINNTTGTALNIARYAISSPAGALSAAQWDSIAVGGNSSISEADAWTVNTNGAVVSGNWLLAESESGGANGAQLAATTGAFNLGNVWVKSTFEDVLVSLELVGGTKIQLLPTFTGDAYDLGDFDGDGDVDSTDYGTLISHLHVAQTAGLTNVQRYQTGDINFNGSVNRDDFLAFRNAYFAANPGAGAAEWNAMVTAAGVPEPTTIWLMTLAGGLLLTQARRRWTIQIPAISQGFATMMHSRTVNRRHAVAVATLAFGVLFARASFAEDVVGWQRYQGNATNAIFLNGSEATNDPVFGNNTTDAIDNSGIWGSLVNNIHLDPSEEAVLHGRVQILGHSGANREFRFGMWKKVVQPNNPNTNATAGWLGYMALNGAGTGTGRLEAKNPDSDFQTALFISDFGGGSIGTASGPVPQIGGVDCDPLGDGSCNGTSGNGRYFLLTEANVAGNAGFANNLWYTFEIRVGRYGQNEATVSASLISDPQKPVGDYNDDGAVNAADYTVWRDHLGTSFALPNRAAANTGNVSQADFTSWSNNFGAVTAVPYSFNIGGGLDVNGQPPVNLTTNPNGTYTPHVTFDFDRVGFLFGGALDADQATFENITINKQTIETLDLLVNPTTGATSIRNNLPSTIDVVYYEITSATNSLRRSGGWTSIDSTEGGDPVGVGWDEAAGSSDGILSEANLTGSLMLDQNDSVGLGNAFRTVANGGTQGTQDLRFFVGLSNGSVLRGTVTYSGAGALAGVPEPATCGMLLAACLGLTGLRQRRGGA